MKKPFWSNVVSVLSGTAVAQLIPIVSALALARLYGPDAFGIYSVWIGIILILAVISTLRLEIALTVIPDGNPRENAVSLLIPTIIMVGTVASCLSFVPWVLGYMTMPLSGPFYVSSVIIGTMACAACDSWQALAAADGDYRTLIRLRISQAVSVALAQLLMAFLIRDALGLICGHLGGLILNLVVATRVRPIRWVHWSGQGGRLWAFWRAHARFPLFALPADACSAFAAQLPMLVVAERFGAANAGILALTFRVLGVPISLLGRAVLDVFRRHAAEAYRERGECRQEYLSTFRTLSIGSLLLVICVTLLADRAFVMGFGEAWRPAGAIAIIMIPMFALRFVASPLSYLFYITGRQHIDLLWQACLLTVTAAALLLSSGFHDTLRAYTYGYCVMYLIYLFLTYRSSRGVVR